MKLTTEQKYIVILAALGTVWAIAMFVGLVHPANAQYWNQPAWNQNVDYWTSQADPSSNWFMYDMAWSYGNLLYNQYQYWQPSSWMNVWGPYGSPGGNYQSYYPLAYGGY